jgi:hypothetical protein
VLYERKPCHSRRIDLDATTLPTPEPPRQRTGTIRALRYSPAVRPHLRPVFVVLVAAHVLLLLAFAGTDPAGPNPPIQRGGDFLPCWAGGTLIAEGRGHELYDPRAFGEVQERVLHQRVKYPSGYPPPVY